MRLIMAPEILKMEPYNEKCDLWSLGVNIYQLYTKKIPYNSTFEMGILKEIKEKKQSVLDIIPEEDALLKDLLSKLLVEDPEKRISFGKNILLILFLEKINNIVFIKLNKKYIFKL